MSLPAAQPDAEGSSVDEDQADRQFGSLPPNEEEPSVDEEPDVDESHEYEPGDSVGVWFVVPQRRSHWLDDLSGAPFALVFDRPVADPGFHRPWSGAGLDISPQVEGQWRSYGPQVLYFEPRGQWPLSHTFQISVGSDFRAIDGESTGEESHFEVTTETANVRKADRSRRVIDVDERFVFLFSQPVDRRSAESITLRVDRREVELQIVEGRARQQAIASQDFEGVDDDRRFLVVEPVEELAPGGWVRVDYDGPVYSLLGPTPGESSRHWSRLVREDFGVTRIGCPVDSCSPEQGIVISLASSLDRTGEFDRFIGVVPPVEGLEIHVASDGLSLGLGGDFSPNQTYRVTVDGTVRDQFDQVLGDDVEEDVQFGEVLPRFLSPGGENFVQTLEEPAEIPLRTVGVAGYSLSLFAVEPEDWVTVRHMRGLRNLDELGEPDRRASISIGADERSESHEERIDLGSVLSGQKPGHILVAVEDFEPSPIQNSRGEQVFWIQRTDLNADISWDQHEMSIHMTRHSDGLPVVNGSVSIAGAVVATTDEDGLARFDVPSGENSTSPLILRAGDDSLLIPVGGVEGRLPYSRGWTPVRETHEAIWQLIGDQQVYGPGDSVLLRGWIRLRPYRGDARLEALREGTELSYRINHESGWRISQGVVDLDGVDGFELEFELPDHLPAGEVIVDLTAPIPDLRLGQSRKRLRLKMRPKAEGLTYDLRMSPGDGHHYVREEARWEVDARYLGGQPIVNGSAYWRFREVWTAYEPPGWAGWHFGARSQWPSRDAMGTQQIAVPGEELESDETVLPVEFRRPLSTDVADGRTHTSLHYEDRERGFPVEVQAAVELIDGNGGSMEAAASQTIHPAKYYVGLRSHRIPEGRISLLDGQPFDVHVVVVDVDGNLVEGREVLLELRGHGDDSGQSYDECQIRSTRSAQRCDFVIGDRDHRERGVIYNVVAVVEDDMGRRSESEMRVPIGNVPAGIGVRSIPDMLVLRPDAKRYRRDDVARIEVVAPEYPITGLLTVDAGGVVDRRFVTLTEESPFVDVDIAESMHPGATVGFRGVYGERRLDGTGLVSGEVFFEVDGGGLEVSLVDSDHTIEPGVELERTIRVRDLSGRPVVGARLTALALAKNQGGEKSEGLVFGEPPRRTVMHLDSRRWQTRDGPAPGNEMHWPRLPRGPKSLIEPKQATHLASFTPMPNRSAFDNFTPFDAATSGESLLFYDNDLITDDAGEVRLRRAIPNTVGAYELVVMATDGPANFGMVREKLDVVAEIAVEAVVPPAIDDERHDWSQAQVIQSERGEPDEPGGSKMAVHRHLEDVESGEELRRRDEGWRAGPNSLIRVVYTLANGGDSGRAESLTLLPPGFEPIRYELGTWTAATDILWYFSSARVQPVRGEHAVANPWKVDDGVLSILVRHNPHGITQYSYVVRLPSEGEYLLPPTRVSVGDGLTQWAKSGTDRVIIE